MKTLRQLKALIIATWIYYFRDAGKRIDEWVAKIEAEERRHMLLAEICCLDPNASTGTIVEIGSSDLPGTRRYEKVAAGWIRCD